MARRVIRPFRGGGERNKRQAWQAQNLERPWRKQLGIRAFQTGAALLARAVRQRLRCLGVYAYRSLRRQCPRRLTRSCRQFSTAPRDRFHTGKPATCAAARLMKRGGSDYSHTHTSNAASSSSQPTNLVTMENGVVFWTKKVIGRVLAPTKTGGNLSAIGSRGRACLGAVDGTSLFSRRILRGDPAVQTISLHTQAKIATNIIHARMQAHSCSPRTRA